MATPDGPQFLSSAPIAPPAPPEPKIAPTSQGPYRTPSPPIARPSAPRMKPPTPAPTPAPVVEEEPDWLARYLGPGRMPRVIMRFPRIFGALLVLVGWYGW